MDYVVESTNNLTGQSLQDRMAHQMWEQVVALFPHLGDKVEYLEGGSPLTHNHYIKSNAGV